MSLYEFGSFALDAERLLLLDRGVPLPIGPKVVETLLALVEHPGELQRKSELLARIWPEGYVDEANLAQNIYVLRKLLRERWDVEAIETIPRRGYRFTAPVLRRERLARPEPAKASPAGLPRRGWAVAAVLALALIGGSALTASRTPSAPHASQSAQDARLYVIGRYYWNLRTPSGIAKSIDYFSRIVADDPHDARGYAGLASANAIMAEYRYGTTPAAVAIARARGYARKALSYDPNSAEAYAVLGLIASEGQKGSRPELRVAVAQLRHAISLDPENGPAHEWYGTALLMQGRVAAAYAELTTAAQLDPLSVSTTAWLGMTAYFERRYRDAIAYARETLDLSPRRADAYETLGLAYEALGDQGRAVENFRRLAAMCAACRPEAAALLTAPYARSNQMELAREELTVAREGSKEVAAEDLALAFEAVGDRGEAIAWLRRARAQGDYTAMEIANDPRFSALRRTSNG